ncbi:MAG: dTDP-4-dehydrorhamnose 3,5-epimerase [bacterium]
MKISATNHPDVLLIEPVVHGDHRGWFMESWHIARYAEAGINQAFVQDNMAHSTKGILRGLHVQSPHAQGKLVQVIRGSVFDVAVDIRQGSPYFGQWVGAELNQDNHHQLWVPPGFAHGYLVLSDEAVFAYKCTDLYYPQHEFSVRWDDPDINIDWPMQDKLKLSDKDREAPLLRDVDSERLPIYEP